MEIGESFVGDGVNAAHINTVLGRRDGPAGTAWATALATPREGHVPFMAVVQPGIAAKPPTLFVNKAPIGSDYHANLTWGAAQAGVAAGVADALKEGLVSEDDVDDLVLITAVWVNPDADDADSVYRNNRAATVNALRAGHKREPRISTVVEAVQRPSNPFYEPPA